MVKKNGSRVVFGDIFRIERHTFNVSFEPTETKVAFRILCGQDVVLKPREVDGTDTVLNDGAPGAAAVAEIVRGAADNQNDSEDADLECDETLIESNDTAGVTNMGSGPNPDSSNIRESDESDTGKNHEMDLQ